MSNNNARDTQFAGFAKLLQDELAAMNGRAWNSLDEYIEAKKLLIAQRSYDFMRHLIGIMPYLVNNANIPTLDAAMQYIPDMTEWPKEK